MSDEAATSVLGTHEADNGNDRQAKRDIRPFPRKTLSDALRVVHAIKEKNAGKPFAPAQIADALGKKPRSSDFGVLLGASQAYGLTEGGAKAVTISLTSLGEEIAYPKGASEERASQVKAFFCVTVFKSVFEHYENNTLPEPKFISNVLENTFKIKRDFVEEFISIFEGNLRFLNVDVGGIISLKSTDIQTNEEKVVTSKSIIRSGRAKAFVIMPFVERNAARSEGFFREVFKSLIEPAAQQAGFDVDWANRAGSDIIQSTIINEVLDADLLIADLTDHNPNVLFELGLRLAYNKGPTALIKSQDTPRLFDVDNMMRVYEYKPMLWKTSLDIDIPNLEEHIRATYENKDNTTRYLDILRKTK